MPRAAAVAPRRARRARRAVLLAAGASAAAAALAAAVGSGGCGAGRAHAAAAAPAVRVALTRQAGENDKLREALRAELPAGAAELLEVPCIEHALCDGFEALQRRLAAVAAGEDPPLCALLTSPEAARVFLQAWGTVGSAERPPPVRVASVGGGTSAVLRGAGIEVAFQPSTANAECLAAELPDSMGPKVLYAASAIAADTLQEGLGARGLQVERLDTYTTRPVASPSAELLAQMASTDVVTFGSPSAVRAWTDCTPCRPVAACIGGTSQKAADACGFKDVFAPEKPGVQGWAGATAEAVRAAAASAAARRSSATSPGSGQVPPGGAVC